MGAKSKREITTIPQRYLVILGKSEESGKAFGVPCVVKHPWEEQFSVVPFTGTPLLPNLTNLVLFLSLPSTVRNWSNLSVLENKLEWSSSSWHRGHWGHYCMHKTPKPRYAFINMGMFLSVDLLVSPPSMKNVPQGHSVYSYRWLNWGHTVH